MTGWRSTPTASPRLGTPPAPGSAEHVSRIFLTREIAAGQPTPETFRRLTNAVLEHQGGLLQDDASILLARWTGGGRSPRIED